MKWSGKVPTWMTGDSKLNASCGRLSAGWVESSRASLRDLRTRTRRRPTRSLSSSAATGRLGLVPMTGSSLRPGAHNFGGVSWRLSGRSRCDCMSYPRSAKNDSIDKNYPTSVFSVFSSNRLSDFFLKMCSRKHKRQKTLLV